MPIFNDPDDAAFDEYLRQLRPSLHRYCARMLGSTVDGEDALQDTLVKALRARAERMPIEQPKAWLFRVAHNTCLDVLRARSRDNVVPLSDDHEAEPLPDAQLSAVSLSSFLRLPELQRCAVILKDVLGHSVDEIADIAGCTPAAAKSALQRARSALQRLAGEPGDVRVPLMSEADRHKAGLFVALFQRGDFDAIRAMLVDDVRVELVNRVALEGRTGASRYFGRYAEEAKWRFALGAVDGRPAMLVFDRGAVEERPAHFVLVEWRAERISAIRDFLFAPYALESADCVLLG